MKAARRVGVFGGAFDPPHRAHVALAHQAVQTLALDELRVLPTGDAWHKARTLTDAAHRLAMTRIAFAEVPRALVDERELRRAGPTYTVDTLRELRAELPQAEFVLLMGEDQAAGFTGWREWPAIAAMVPLAVAARGTASSGAGLALLKTLPGVRVLPIPLPPRDESATDIRTRRAAGQDISDLVAPGVASYIDQHSLYLPA